MFDVESIQIENYSKQYNDRFESYYVEEEYDECECGNHKEKDQVRCEICKSKIIRQFNDLLNSNFDTEEIEIINEYLNEQEI